MRPDRRQAIHPGAAQGPQQERFGLVIAVVRQCEVFAFAQDAGERFAAHVPCRGFQARTAVARHRHADHLQGNRPGRADRLAVRRPTICIGLQAVVHVHRMQAGGPLRG